MRFPPSFDAFKRYFTMNMSSYDRKIKFFQKTHHFRKIAVFHHRAEGYHDMMSHRAEKISLKYVVTAIVLF